MAKQMKAIIDQHPSYGLRRIFAILVFSLGFQINRKRVLRIYRENNWQIQTRPKGGRPRVKRWPSRCDRLDQRWAIDTTHLFCGQDGWCHLTAIIDCCNREIVGWRFSRRGIAKVAAAALEDALLKRKKLPGSRSQLALRSDNGLVFGSKAFTKVVRRYGLQQVFITPYTPQQNGMIERFFRSFKEELVWLQTFHQADQAFRVIADWIDFYNQQQRHAALGYQSPVDYARKIAA